MYRNKDRGRRWRSRGFSLMEILIVVAVVTIAASLTLPAVRGTLDYLDGEAALNMTMGQLRRARQQALDLRRVFRVGFTLPRTMVLQRRDDGSWTEVTRVDLPGQMEFRIAAGLPTSEEATPDRMGADTPVDFNGAVEIYFRPDGAAIDSDGQITGGILYLAEPGKLDSARAVTLFGSTGRLRPWHFEGGVWK